MEYALIILVIAVALAPLSHFVPSKRQRQVARLRETAAVSGLFVEFRDLPQGEFGSAGQRAESKAKRATIYYGKRLPPARGEAGERGSWIVDAKGWRSLLNHGAPPEILLQFPSSVLAASVDQGSCGIYWQEAGEEGELTEIIRVLDDWASQLRP